MTLEDSDPQLPPPPAGYTLDAVLPPPPAGYTLDRAGEPPIRYVQGMPVYSSDPYNPQQAPVFQGNDPQGKPILGVPPPPPRPPLAHGLGNRLETMDPRTGEFIQSPKMGDVPLLDAPYRGYRQAEGGYERIRDTKAPTWSPDWRHDIAGGTSEIIRGGLEAATPFLPAAIAGAPLATAITLASGTGLSAGTEWLLNKAKVPKEYSALAGDIIGLFGAGYAYKKLYGLAKIPYLREANAIEARLKEAVAQASDMSLTEMQRNAARAKVEGLMDGLQQAEAGVPGTFDLPQLGPKDLIPRVRVPGMVKNRLNPVEQASQDYMTERNIDTPLSMQTGNKVAANIEGTLPNAPGGGYAQTAREKTRADLLAAGQQHLTETHPESFTPEEAGASVKNKLAEDLEMQRIALAGQVSPTPSTPELAGTKVLEAGRKKIEAFSQAADEAYKAAWAAEQHPANIRDVPVYDKTGRPVVDEQGNPVTEKMALPVDVTDVARELKPVADRYERTLSDTDAHASLGLKAMRNFIKDAVSSPKRPLRAVEADLSMFKEAARNENIPELRDTSQGLAALSVKALQDKIDQTMATAAYPGWDPNSGTTSPALRHLRSGRAATAQKYEVADVFAGFGRKNINDLEPVGVHRGLTWAGDAGIQRLRDVAATVPEQMPEVGRAFIDGGGNWKTLGPETKKILFRDPEVIAGLDKYYANNERFGPLTKLEPVDLFTKLTAPKGRKNELLSDLSEQAPEQMPKLARAYVQGLLDYITREGDVKKVQTALNSFLDMDGKTKDMLFQNPGLVQNWQNLFFSLNRLNKEVNTSGTSYVSAINKMKGDLLRGVFTAIGGTAGAVTHGGGGATAGGGLGWAAGAGAEMGANALLSRLLFNPKWTRMLTRGINEGLKGNKAGVDLTERTLTRMAAEELLGDAKTPTGPPEGPPEGGGPPPPSSPSGGTGGGGTPPAAGGQGGGRAGLSNTPAKELNDLLYGSRRQYRDASVERTLREGEAPPAGSVVEGAPLSLATPEERAAIDRQATANQRPLPPAGGSPNWRDLPPLPTEAELTKPNITPQQHFEVQKLASEQLGETKGQPEGWRDKLNQASDKAGERIDKFWKDQGTELHAGLPVHVLADYAIVGARKIVDGAEKFSDWSKGMVDDFGDKVQPHLQNIWREAQHIAPTLSKMRKADRAAGSEQSTRVPTAVKATEDPLSNILTTGYKSWMRDPEMLRKNVNAMLDYPNFRDLQAQVKSGALSIPDAAEQIIGRVQENLQWLHDSMPANFRDRARLWYDGAHTIARKWSGDYKATPEQVAASMAVTSPGTDWFVNAERARRLLEFWQDRGSKKWDPRMEATWRDKISKAIPEQDRDQRYNLIKGKSFKQVAKDPDVAAIWFRLYEEAVNPREYSTLTPEGKAGDLARVQSGDPRQFSWSDFGQIRKVLSILEDGSKENIHRQLGQEHKVRNFYNNIINPDSPREHTTIDTHAVAAGLVRPLSQMSTEVGHNFGGAGSSSSSVSGESGTYGLHKEAYRRVAAANGLLPREMQSITWEAIRSMFSPAFKRNPANVEYINSLWEDVSSGKITADAARQRALQFAGGFDQPEWFRGRWNPAVPKAAKPSSKSR